MSLTAAGRNLVLQVIEKVDAGEQLQSALNDALHKKGIAGKEAAACADLLYSFFRHRLTANWILERLLQNPSKMPPRIRLLLALAIISLFYQAQAAEYAVVSETVAVIKKDFGKILAGVSNAVLRNLLRQKSRLLTCKWFETAVDARDSFLGSAIYYGMPQEIASVWRKSYGEKAALNLMARSSLRPWKGLLVNTFYPAAEKLQKFFQKSANERIVRIGKWGFAVAPGAMPAEICRQPLEYWLREGAIFSLAAGSQIILKELGVDKWEAPVWDCCAGVGGKTRFLINSGVNVLLASDVSFRRSGQFFSLWSNYMPKPAFYLRMSACQPALSSWDGNILADAPCSGWGVLARRPDLRRVSANFQMRLAELENLQFKIFIGLLQLLKPGRELAWITCTLNPAENHEMLERVLKSFPSCKVMREWQTPHDHPWLEGMYGAVLKRN